MISKGKGISSLLCCRLLLEGEDSTAIDQAASCRDVTSAHDFRTEPPSVRTSPVTHFISDWCRSSTGSFEEGRAGRDDRKKVTAVVPLVNLGYSDSIVSRIVCDAFEDLGRSS